MTVENPELNPNSQEPEKAYPSIDELKVQSAGIIKDLFLTIGIPEVMEDGLITQEEGKKLFQRYEAFAREYNSKTGKSFDIDAIAIMAGYMGVEGEEKIMQELGINIPRDQIKLEMEDGRILSTTEACQEMQQKQKELSKDAIKNNSRQERAELIKEIKKNPKSK